MNDKKICKMMKKEIKIMYFYNFHDFPKYLHIHFPYQMLLCSSVSILSKNFPSQLGTLVCGMTMYSPGGRVKNVTTSRATLWFVTSSGFCNKNVSYHLVFVYTKIINSHAQPHTVVSGGSCWGGPHTRRTQCGGGSSSSCCWSR